VTKGGKHRKTPLAMGIRFPWRSRKTDEWRAEQRQLSLREVTRRRWLAARSTPVCREPGTLTALGQFQALEFYFPCKLIWHQRQAPSFGPVEAIGIAPARRFLLVWRNSSTNHYTSTMQCLCSDTAWLCSPHQTGPPGLCRSCLSLTKAAAVARRISLITCRAGPLAGPGL
jgi:hypothetical protein